MDRAGFSQIWNKAQRYRQTKFAQSRRGHSGWNAMVNARNSAGGRHASCASAPATPIALPSVSQSVRPPPRRGLASYCGQFVTLKFILPMRGRLEALCLKVMIAKLGCFGQSHLPHPNERSMHQRLRGAQFSHQ